jgi:anti-sigma-K factor RskA
MQNVDELCIKYVLNELDPAERHYVEQAMQDDENVLIEVESLRSTLRKLNNLPQKEPPKHVQELILEKAAQESKKKSALVYSRIAWAGMLAAAVLLLAIGVNYYNLSGETELQNNASIGLQDTETSTQTAPVLLSQPASLIPATTTQRNVVEPWVDRQNVLQLQLTHGPNGQVKLSPGTETERANAAVLRPVQSNSNNRQALPVARDIQLTRTQN